MSGLITSKPLKVGTCAILLGTRGGANDLLSLEQELAGRNQEWGSMRIMPLRIEHSADIVRLATEYYTDRFHLSLEQVEDNFRDLDDDDANFCFALVDGDQFMGYIFAWLSNTLLEGRREDVVVVDDLVVAKKARRHVYRLIEAMVNDFEAEGFGGLPIEGAVRKTIESTFLGHAALFQRLGYELVGQHEYVDDDLDEAFVWVRFEALEAEESTRDTGTLL